MALSSKVIIYCSILVATLVAVSIVLTIVVKKIMSNSSGANSEDINVIINTHNKFRATVALGELEGQPSAENMQEMTWDEELASKAQYWADRRKFEHGGFDKSENIGQNLYIKRFGGPHIDGRQHNYTAAITSWYEEHVYYTYKKLQKGDSADRKTQTGHYTQVVWADTGKVGCGFASYYQAEKQKDEILYVCNYRPAGNYEDKYPYIKGEPNCKAHGMSNSDIKGLCRK